MKGIIIGGGIGGLTTAIALAQRGISATVFEAAPEIRAVGAGIIMATNAMQVLQRLGLADKVKEKGYRLTGGQIADQNWRPIQTIFADYAIQKFGVGSYAIHRAALQQILFQELPVGTVHLNHKLESVKRSGDKVRVTFANGFEDEADFVIGADGIKSAVRQSRFEEAEYRYSGQTCWRATVNTSIPQKLEKSAFELWGSQPGLRWGMVPVTSNQIYFYATVCAPAGERDDINTLVPSLVQQFGEFGETVTNLLAKTDPRNIIRTDIYDFAPIKKWYQGPIALLGDAAHATTPNLGQGGCQAVEDAYVIAKTLSEHVDPEKAFEAYQAIRYAKAKYVVDTSWMFGKLTNLSSPWIHLRNAAIRLTPASAAKKSSDKLFQLNY